MSSILQDLWIIKEDSGIVLFNRAHNKEVNPQLFGGLMSALDSFAENIDEDGINSFEFSDKRFCLKNKDGILCVGNSCKDTDVEKLHLKIEKILERFCEKYSKEFFEIWEGNIELFSDFECELNDLIKAPVKKFWDGL